MPSPIHAHNVERDTKNYLKPIVLGGLDLIKKTSKVAFGILACTAFVASVGLLLQAYTSLALPSFFAQCLVREAVLPVTGSCLILGLMITLGTEIRSAFNKSSWRDSETPRSSYIPNSRLDDGEKEVDEIG